MSRAQLLELQANLGRMVSTLSHDLKESLPGLDAGLYNIIDNAVDACIDSSASVQHRVDPIVQVARDKAILIVQGTGGGISG